VRALEQALVEADLVVVDEIGKMELHSKRFRSVVEHAVDGPKPVLGTVMMARDPWVDAIKARPAVHTWVLNGANRRRVRQEVLARLTRALTGPRTRGGAPSRSGHTARMSAPEPPG
jgi:nucleoside-triphosphatase